MMETPITYIPQGCILKLESEEVPILVEFLRKQSIGLECIDFKQNIVSLPQSYVGYISLPNRRIVINPKHDGLSLSHVLRIYYFLFSVDNADLDDQIYDIDSGNVFDLLTVYIAELKKIIQKGLPVSYYSLNNDFSYLRGHLNVVNTKINQTLRKNDIFSCNYDELSFDNPLNQVLLAAFKKATQIINDENTNFIAKHFLGINERINISATIELNRHTVYCKKALSLAYMILNDLNISDYGNSSFGDSLLINFDKVFEEFVKAVLVKYSADNNFTYWDESKPYAICRASADDFIKSYLPDMLYSYQDSIYPNSAFCILDMKNKTSKPFSNPDVYQLFFYANMLHSKKVILCYPSMVTMHPAVLKFDNESFNIHKMNAVYINIAGNTSLEFKNNIYDFIENVKNIM